MNKETDLAALLNMRVLAVVGCSPSQGRPSNTVSGYLMDVGYWVFPVNPNQDDILGEKCYPDLKSIPEKVDVVVVFRRAEFVQEIVENAITAGAKGIWLQDGIDVPKAVTLAREKGLIVVVNDCMMRQHLSRMGR